MSTPVHERLLKDLDQLRHVHGLPPSQVAAKTAKYLSDLRATGEADGLQEQALQCRAQQIMEYLCLTSCVDLLRKQAPSTAALVQGLLQQSYASNKTLWHQLTTAGQAQVQLFRDMQHQKTIAQVMQGEVNDLQHKLDRLMQHLSSTIPSTLVSMPSRATPVPTAAAAATASSSRSSSSSGVGGSPRLQQHRSWSSTAGPSRESSLTALPPAAATSQAPSATAAAAVAAAVAAAGARAKPYADLPAAAAPAVTALVPPSQQERAVDASQPDAPQHRASDHSPKEATLAPRPTPAGPAPGATVQAATAPAAAAAAPAPAAPSSGASVGVSAVRAALRVQPPPVVRPAIAVTSPVGSARQATRWLRAVASNTRPLAPVLEVPTAPAVAAPPAFKPAPAAGPVTQGSSGHVASYAVAVSAPPSAEPSEEGPDMAGGLLGLPRPGGVLGGSSSRAASRAGDASCGPHQKQLQQQLEEEEQGGGGGAPKQGTASSGAPHRHQEISAGPQSWPMTFDSSSAGSTPVAELSETPRFEVPASVAALQQVEQQVEEAALQQQPAVAVGGQGRPQQGQGSSKAADEQQASSKVTPDQGRQQQSPSDSSGVMFASPDTAATRGVQQQAGAAESSLGAPAPAPEVAPPQQLPPAADARAAAAAASAGAMGPPLPRAGSSASSMSRSSSYSRLPGPPSRPSSTCSAAAGGSVVSTGRSSGLGVSRPPSAVAPPLGVTTSPGRSASGPLTSGRNLWHRRSRAAAVAASLAPELQVVGGDDSGLSQQGGSRGPPSAADDVQMASPGAEGPGSSWGMAGDSRNSGSGALRGRGGGVPAPSGSSSSTHPRPSSPPGASGARQGEGPPSSAALRASGGLGRASVASNGSMGSSVPSRLPSPEKVGLVEPPGGAGGGCSDLTLVELRAIVADVWNNKAQDDARADEERQPRTTLAAYLDRYLADKTPHRQAAQQAGSMVRQGLRRWGEEVPEVRLFAKVLEHQVNEQYQADFTARKQQLRRLLEPLAGPRPASRSKEDGSTAGQQQQQQQLDLGSPEVRAVLRRWLGQRGSLIALLEGLRRRYGTGPLGAEQVVAGALLWDLSQQEARLHTVRSAFSAVDTGRTGVLDKAQFVAFCNRFCHEVAQEEAEQLYCTELDPWGHQRVTFSAIAYCLLQVASDEGAGE